jgi:hypothetical protein
MMEKLLNIKHFLVENSLKLKIYIGEFGCIFYIIKKSLNEKKLQKWFWKKSNNWLISSHMGHQCKLH